MGFSLSGILSLNIQGFQDSLRRATGSVDGLRDSAGGAGSSIKSMIGVAAGFAGVSISAGHAVTTFMDFEKEMSNVQAISEASKSELDMLSQKAMEMGRILPASAKDAAKAMANLASAGFKTDEVMASIEGTLYLAASAQTDMATAADITSSTLRGFGLEASNASHVADVLARTAADTNAGILDTGEAMKYIAPVANAMKISLEETAGAIGILANAGIKGSQAGTTLRGALIRLTKPAKPARMAMEQLGFSAFDSAGQMKPLAQTIGELNEKTAGMTDEQKNSAIATIFGVEALSGMLALMQAGKKPLEDLTQSFKDSDGAAKKMAETQTNNMYGALEEVKGQFETLEITLVGKFAPAVTMALKTVGDYIPIVANELMYLLGVIGDHTQTIGLVIGVYTGYKVAVMGAIAVESILGALLVAKAVAMEVYTALWIGYTMVTEGASIATGLFTTAQLLLNMAMTANPIGLIVTGLGLMVGAVMLAYNKLEWFRDLVDGVWSALKKMGSAVAGAFSGIGSAKTSTPIPANANGTSYFGGGLSQVNERGGEMQIMPSGTGIIPAERTQQLLSGNTEKSNNVTIHIDARGMQVDELVDQLKTRLSNI